MLENNVVEMIKSSHSFLQNLYECCKEDTTAITKIQTQDELRNEVANFVTHQMSAIKRQDILRGLIESELANKILLHELDTEQLQALYSTISHEKTKSTNSLLELFKPTQTTNALMTPPTNEDTYNEADNLNAEQRNSINKLYKVIEALNNKEVSVNDL